ncbi:uncharacterized protein K460DRAFT_205195 [Cucurbitaria berberidis CBS 394.84]|uniref:Uncharacterized protein n=1 Tax=Cucurbitaria berberidis CBS 394.84 TaxID=1168544 RepID=A0A9P4G720_9PLEO|nr:uncharacterized protein K460DRAFT_205195 [Cucurbitaria berberidis CBS 394.84]KAF1840226.1 hypothetical protein K460DRAFT_205195 [Cucurbitaria berberidis CBS 394.84]
MGIALQQAGSMRFALTPLLTDSCALSGSETLTESRGIFIVFSMASVLVELSRVTSGRRWCWVSVLNSLDALLATSDRNVGLVCTSCEVGVSWRYLSRSLGGVSRLHLFRNQKRHASAIRNRCFHTRRVRILWMQVFIEY